MLHKLTFALAAFGVTLALLVGHDARATDDDEVIHASILNDPVPTPAGSPVATPQTGTTPVPIDPEMEWVYEVTTLPSTGTGP